MNLKVVLALVLVAVGVAVGVTSFRKSVTPYITFSEARRTTGLVQVNGNIADKNYVLKPREQYLSFNLRDQQGEVMPVIYHGVIPGNFDQATMVVAIGRYQDDHFQAEQLLVKCPSKYQAEADKQQKAAT
jgi:cytochrome c-type biogenesis protein CcmE